MARFIDAIDLPIPPEEAFDYLADFSNTAEWDPSVVSARRLTRGEPGQGSRFRVAVGFAGRTLALDYEIEAFEPPSRIVLRGGDDSLDSVDEITFTPREGGTRVTYEARIELRGLRRLADPLVHLLFQRVGQMAARGLRERIEERERSGSAGTKTVSPRRSPRVKSARTGKSAPRRKGNADGPSRTRSAQ